MQSPKSIISIHNDPIKVLYVDDEINNLNVFRASFREKFEIYTAISAVEAHEILEKHEIPIIIADQRMPVVTGVEFLISVKNKFPKTVRILLTGYIDIGSVIEAMNKGGVSFYISKPWDPEQIISCINERYIFYKENLNKDLQIESLNLAIQELKERINYEYQHYTLFLNNNLSIAIKQYLVFFKEFVHLSKKKDIHFEVRSVNNGLEIELNKYDDQQEIMYYLNEYISFLKVGESINPVVVDSSQMEKELLIIRLESEKRHLQTSLDFEKIRSSQLNLQLNDMIEKFHALLVNNNPNAFYHPNKERKSFKKKK